LANRASQSHWPADTGFALFPACWRNFKSSTRGPKLKIDNVSVPQANVARRQVHLTTASTRGGQNQWA
jgi:hypothetical protein